MRPFRLSRRTFLRGTGAALALPTLECMLNNAGTAYAGGAPLPKRFATFFFGNGIIRGRWAPTTTGAGWQLSEELAPLVNVKDYVNVITGYDVDDGYDNGHNSGAESMLSGVPMHILSGSGGNRIATFNAPSVDQVAANIIAGNTTFPSLQIGITRQADTGNPGLGYISFSGAGQQMIPTYSPASLYSRLFGNFTAPVTTDPTPTLRVSALDAVKADAARLRLKLGSSDRMRLDSHMTNLSELRQQIVALPPMTTASCMVPANTSNANGSPEMIGQVCGIFGDILAAAWACDLTRVASIQFSSSAGSTMYSEIGQTTEEHTLTHDSSAQDQVHDAVVYAMKCYATLLEKLKATPDGAGTLLDNSLVFCCTDVSVGLTHELNDQPVLFGGRAGGYLRYPGVHARGSGGSAAPIGNVLLTALRAVGTGLTSFGSGGLASNGEVTAVVA